MLRHMLHSAMVTINSRVLNPRSRYFYCHRQSTRNPTLVRAFTDSSDTALASRLKLMDTHQFELIRIVGVSFEGRQSILARLHREQGLAFIKEPSNPYDPNAVAVSTLNGTSIGYIPRDNTSRFVQDLCFGLVYSVGLTYSEDPTKERNYGLKAAVRPELPPVCVVPAPKGVEEWIHDGVVARVSKDTWKKIEQETLQHANNLCEITGESNPVVTARWHIDDDAKVAHLSGFRAVSPTILEIESMMDGKFNKKKFINNKELLKAMNAWSDSDVDQYLAQVSAVAEARQSADEENYSVKIDQSLQEELGITL